MFIEHLRCPRTSVIRVYLTFAAHQGMVVAAITSNSHPLAVVAAPDMISADCMMPASAAKKATIAMTVILILPT